MDNAMKKFYNLILAVVAIVPLVIIPFANRETSDFFYGPKVAVLTFFAIIYLLILLKNRDYIREILNNDFINLALLSYFILLVISLFFAEDIQLALSGSPFRVEGFGTIAVYMLLFLAARSISHLDEKLLKAILFTATLVAFYGIIQHYGIRLFPRDYLRTTWSKPFSTMGNPNFLGSYLVLTLPIAMDLFIKYKVNYAAVSFAILFFCLLATMTRGAWIGGAVAIISYLLLIRFYLPDYHNYKSRIIIVLILIVSLLIWFNLQSDGSFLNRIFSITNGFKEGEDIDRAGSGRIFIWKGVINMIKEKPLFGVGIENLAEPFFRINRFEVLKTFGEFWKVDKAHNEYLNIAATTGIPSLLIYLSFITLIIRQGFLKIKSDPLLLAIMASVIGYLVQAFFNISVVTVAYIFWIFLGFLANKNHLGYETI